MYQLVLSQTYSMPPTKSNQNKDLDDTLQILVDKFTVLQA